ncbi:MAG TPA: substrate-binding domain-containing protein [Thermodesulfobacteriota bacterium]|nr:substrate-binding domain-containing protein [Thermodesulfobacteriota bacterium]
MKKQPLAFILRPLFLAFLMILLVIPASAQVTTTPVDQTAVALKAYGPGGPAPAMRESAKVFGAKKGIQVEINAGPTPTWKERALKDADLIFSGSEYMMTDFLQKDLPGLIDASTIRSLYLRPSAILVRPGNPKGIQGIRDLARPGLRILVVQGAGQVGLWEDVAGRTGKVKLVEDVRRNIGFFAPNSAEAKKLWSSDPGYDAWLIWTIWQKENPAAADLIPTEPEQTIYRSCGLAITNRSERKALAKEFADFLQSAAGREIFLTWGWMAP